MWGPILGPIQVVMVGMIGVAVAANGVAVLLVLTGVPAVTSGKDSWLDLRIFLVLATQSAAS